MNLNKSSKWLYIVLLLSLGLNVFTIGYYVGNPFHAKTETVSLNQAMKGAFKNLGPEKRHIIVQSMKKQREAIAANNAKLFDLRIDMAKLLKEDPVNKEKLDNVIAQMQTLRSANMNIAQDAIVQTLVDLPAKERQQIADKILNRGKLPAKE